ncbi:TonB-dependent receptor [Christiangramia salexigens]|uniref:TonB-dependent receptor n=1 Tax=Christiangramia salexigens TaxID=1913577 RepID=A0A1L3J878_9FLAO|nr:TonB-dependent receptor [Christiangramia salexigens]APG58898.1 TonB-dependent receptor [Christiangramia salexigens]APG61328.1 TonB-dependent receptor [Christiangramia salexigens]
MQFKSIKKALFLSLFIFSGILYAQDPLGSETVTVVKPYTPSVKDASKIKESPNRNDSVSLQKKPVKYSIFSVPVASTFTPTKGRATAVEKVRPPKIYDNYATLGFGNYSNVLAEFYSSLELTRSSNFGIFLNHNSSQGGIDGVQLDDKFYDTELNLNYNTRNRDLSWIAEVGGEHQLFNWYGLPESSTLNDEQLDQIDPAQNYYSVYLGNEIELYDSFFESAKAKFRHSGDSYKTAENHFTAEGLFELNIADELITTELKTDIVNGRFEQDYVSGDSYDYTFMNFSLSPSLLILRDDLSVNLGVNFVYGMDLEMSDNNFYIYPAVKASYKLAGDMLTAYAGLEGGLDQNTYYDFYQANPYVSPTLQIQPTDNEYNGYIGGKGKLSNAISYNLRGSYQSQFNKALFKRNYDASVLEGENYTYGNSFQVVYDDVNTLSFYGELNVDVNRDFRLGINAQFFDYSTNDQVEAWNLPNMKASLNADYQITKKWYAGTNLFYVGERKDEFRSISLVASEPVVTLDSYFDANAHLGYRFNERLSAFVKGSNLLGNNYQKWMDYQVQGLQVLGGATYKFDF